VLKVETLKLKGVKLMSSSTFRVGGKGGGDSEKKGEIES
jgi:hypothetical protein